MDGSSVNTDGYEDFPPSEVDPMEALDIVCEKLNAGDVAQAWLDAVQAAVEEGFISEKQSEILFNLSSAYAADTMAAKEAPCSV